MALTHIAQAFSADPFLKVTQYDTEAFTATPMTFDPQIVARPSEVRFTVDQDGLLVVTDRVAAGVKVLEENPSTTNIVMSRDGSIFVEQTAAGSNVYRRNGNSYRKVNSLLDPGYTVSGVSDDGSFFVLHRGLVSGSVKVYKRFGSSFAMDDEFAVGDLYVAPFVVNNHIFYQLLSAPLITRQHQVFGGADAAVFGNSNYLAGRWMVKSNDGMRVAMRMQLASNNRTQIVALRYNPATDMYVTGSAPAVFANDRIVPAANSYNLMMCFSPDNSVLLAVTHQSGTPYRLVQWAVIDTGTWPITSDVQLSAGNQSSWTAGFLEAPPYSNPDSKIALNANGIGRYMSKVGDIYEVSSGSFNMDPSIFHGWLGSAASDPILLSRASSGGSSPLVPYVLAGDTITSTSAIPMPEYDDNFPTNGVGIGSFGASEDGSVVAYTHSETGTNTLYAGNRENVSPLGTYVSYYERNGTAWILAGMGDHPAGFSVKNIAFRGDVGDAVSYFLTSGPDDAIEGRYVYDGSDGAMRLFDLTGEVTDPALANNFMNYGWDDYFVSTFQYSDSRPAALKLYQFTGLDMKFVERDSEDIVFGPVALTNCWDIIVANGPLSNPFTLYKRVGNEIVQQPPFNIEWFEQYGNIVDMVALDDCTGFIVVTDEHEVIVVELGPEDEEDPEKPREGEIKDSVELFPDVPPDMYDPNDPVNQPPKPSQPPSGISYNPNTGEVSVSYPPNPSQPGTGQGGLPGSPSAPIYPPTPWPVDPSKYPPGTVPPNPPGQPPPTNMETEDGESIRVIARTARVSVNVAFER